MAYRALAVAVAALAVPILSSIAANPETGRPVILALDTVSLVPGTNVVVRLRGLKLDGARELRIQGAKGTVTSTIREVKKADPPAGLEARDVGDIRVEVGLDVPPEAAPGEWEIRLVTPAGESPPRRLRLVEASSRLEEHEPNGGFREAQPVEPGQIVRGRIQSDKDVDVFRLAGRPGARVEVEVFAARGGSLLDGILSLYDARGRLLASQDEGASGGRDPRIEFRIPSEGEGKGTCFLVLMDAHDRGGEWHPYELSIRGIPEP